MVNHSDKKIKEKLSDFLEWQSEFEVNFDKLSKIEYEDIPMNSNLMSYCFDNVLGFNVKYRIYEKINYIIEFNYKGHYGKICHSKSSYLIMVESEILHEVIDTLFDAKLLLEDYFLSLAEEGMGKNEITIANEYFYFSDKFIYLEEKIESINVMILNMNKNGPKLLSPENVKDINKFYSDNSKLRRELKYLIEFYIDTFYSYLEHVLTLLYPFTENFDIEDPYIKKIQNPRWGWIKKINDVFSEQIDVLNMEILNKVKEVYRNRVTHGMFSRELKVFVHIDKFGRYPLYVGKIFLRGFINESEFEISYSLFKDLKVVFNDFFLQLENLYELEMIYIESGLSVEMNIREWLKNYPTREELEYEIDKIHYEMNNQINMDW